MIRRVLKTRIMSVRKSWVIRGGKGTDDRSDGEIKNGKESEWDSEKDR